MRPVAAKIARSEAVPPRPSARRRRDARRVNLYKLVDHALGVPAIVSERYRGEAQAWALIRRAELWDDEFDRFEKLERTAEQVISETLAMIEAGDLGEYFANVPTTRQWRAWTIELVTAQAFVPGRGPWKRRGREAGDSLLRRCRAGDQRQPVRGLRGQGALALT